MQVAYATVLLKLPKLTTASEGAIIGNRFYYHGNQQIMPSPVIFIPPKRERNREPEKAATEGKLLREKEHAGAGWETGGPMQGLSGGVPEHQPWADHPTGLTTIHGMPLQALCCQGVATGGKCDFHAEVQNMGSIQTG